ncbi:MAG: GNAT family N-acetyltransferase [Bacteroidota bacterium]
MATIQYSDLSQKSDFLSELAHLYFKQWGYEDPNRSLATEIEALQKSLIPHQYPYTIIAHTGNQLIGAGQLKWKEMTIYPDQEYWLGGVLIKPPFRGQGIAKDLIERLIERAEHLKIATLYLQTERLDGGLYAELGWQKLELVDYHQMKILVMQKRLNNATSNN